MTHLEVVDSITPSDFVLMSSHKGDRKFLPFLVVAKGTDTLEGIAFAYDGYQTKGQHKGGVRHISDPVWDDPLRSSAIISDGDGGCFILHPKTEMLYALIERITDLEERLGDEKPRGKPGRKPAVVAPAPAPVDPPAADQKFRVDANAPELTPEQKKARADALADALSGAR